MEERAGQKTEKQSQFAENCLPSFCARARLLMLASQVVSSD